ncbi:hypothetical protein [Bradyrhizobium sp.]|uniref:hypothetical protein n=1 Tax=Bradyrhizobium sp. TaxID=376 RepID=UPI0039E49995
MNLYDDLRSKVDAAGFPMTTVCDRAGVSSGTPSHWGAGRVTPNQSTYDRLMTALAELIAERNASMKAAGLV